MLGLWLALGIIACAVIVVKSLGEEGSLQQVVAENVENAESESAAVSLPAFKKESGLSEVEKLRNPLIVNHTGLVQVVTNIKGEKMLSLIFFPVWIRGMNLEKRFTPRRGVKL